MLHAAVLSEEAVPPCWRAGRGGGRWCQDHVLLRSDSHLETKAAGVGLRFVSYPVIPTWPAGAAGCPASQDGSQLINTVPRLLLAPRSVGGGPALATGMPTVPRSHAAGTRGLGRA